MIEVVPATMEHARAIRLRDGDAMEIAALGETQESALAKTLGRALWAETYLVDGEPGAIAELRTQYELLVSFVHADYARSIRWLKWLGFDLGPAVPTGPLGAPFRQATMRGLA